MRVGMRLAGFRIQFLFYTCRQDTGVAALGIYGLAILAGLGLAAAVWWQISYGVLRPDGDHDWQETGCSVPTVITIGRRRQTACTQDGRSAAQTLHQVHRGGSWRRDIFGHQIGRGFFCVCSLGWIFQGGLATWQAEATRMLCDLAGLSGLAPQIFLGEGSGRALKRAVPAGSVEVPGYAWKPGWCPVIGHVS
jgi:hypothetical protein